MPHAEAFSSRMLSLCGVCCTSKCMSLSPLANHMIIRLLAQKARAAQCTPTRTATHWPTASHATTITMEVQHNWGLRRRHWGAETTGHDHHSGGQQGPHVTSNDYLPNRSVDGIVVKQHAPTFGHVVIKKWQAAGKRASRGAGHGEPSAPKGMSREGWGHRGQAKRRHSALQGTPW